MNKNKNKNKEKESILKLKNKRKPKLHLDSADWSRAEKIFQSDRDDILGSLKRKMKRYPYAEEILKLFAGGTFFAACLVMPGLTRLLEKDSKKIFDGQGYNQWRLKQVLKRLKEQKDVEVVETKEGWVLRITERGLVRTLKYKLEEMKVDKPARWDGKWRMIIFDVPEGRRGYRDIFRDYLKQLGFYRLQRSVFVHPYPCFDQIEFLRQVFQIGGDVAYILAEKIEGQVGLKAFFGL